MAIHDARTVGRAGSVEANGQETPSADTDADEAAEFEAFMNSTPLPDDETLEARSKALLEYLDELDEKYGPEPPEVQEAAHRAYQEMRARLGL